MKKVINNVLNIVKNIKAVLILFLIIIVCFFIFLLLQLEITSIHLMMTTMISLLSLMVAYEVFNYTKLHDIPYLSVEIVNMGIYSEDEIRTSEDMRKRKIPRLVFKNMGNEGLEARLGVYLYEWTEGSVEREDLTNDKFFSKLEKIESDLEINIKLRPNEINDSYSYDIIEATILQEMHKKIRKERKEEGNEETKQKEEEIKKIDREYMYFNSKKPHLIVFKGEYKSICEDSMSKFYRIFFLFYNPMFDEWTILPNNIEFKAGSPQKKTVQDI